MLSKPLPPQIRSHKAYVPPPPLPSVKRPGSSCRKTKMEDLPLGYHFQPTDQEILRYLYHYVNTGQPLQCGFIVEANLKDFQVEQAPDVSMLGSLGRQYYYMDCIYKQVGRPTRDRRPVNGKGFWKSTEGQKTICYENGQIAGYKQDFRFRRIGGEAVDSTNWVMTEYTLESNKSCNNRKAVCVLRNTGVKSMAAGGPSDTNLFDQLF